MRRHRWIAHALVLPALIAAGAAACGAPPMKRNITSSFPMTVSFDRVWVAVLEVLLEMKIPVQTSDRGSGIIVSSWRPVPETWLDCGKNGLFSTDLRRPEGMITIFVTDDPAGATLKVVARYRTEKQLLEETKLVDCSSTGFVEYQIEKGVDIRVGVMPADAAAR